MVDARDLKSLGPQGRAGSSPAAGTNEFEGLIAASSKNACQGGNMTRKLALLATALLSGAVGWLIATIGDGSARANEKRFPQLTMEQLSAEQKPLGEQI